MNLMDLLTSDNTYEKHVDEYLMLKDTKVLRIGKNSIEILDRRKLPIGLRAYRELSFSNVYEWLNRRVIPLDRENSKKILNRLGLSQQDKISVVRACKALSLTDSYWLKESDSTDTWSKVNLFKNKFSEAVAEIAFVGSSNLTIEGSIATPETTAQGSYAKCWVREKDIIYLYKGNTLNGKESQIEVFVSEVLDVMNIPHVKYEMSSYKGRVGCKCELITNEDISIVPFFEFDSFYKIARGESSINYIAKHYSEDFYRMLLVDGIIKNIDRHNFNWGFMMDANTGDVLGLHKLFDHNCSLGIKDEEPSLLYSGKSLLDVAKYAYRKLIKPSYVENLYAWLHSAKCKKLLRRLDLSDDIRNMLIERVSVILEC